MLLRKQLAQRLIGLAPCMFKILAFDSRVPLCIPLALHCWRDSDEQGLHQEKAPSGKKHAA